MARDGDAVSGLKSYRVDRMVALREAYTAALVAEITAHPDEYMDTPETAPSLAAKLCASMHVRGVRAVLLGAALKRALRTLKLKPTYTALEAWLTEQPS